MVKYKVTNLHNSRREKENQDLKITRNGRRDKESQNPKINRNSRTIKRINSRYRKALKTSNSNDELDLGRGFFQAF